MSTSTMLALGRVILKPVLPWRSTSKVVQFLVDSPTAAAAFAPADDAPHWRGLTTTASNFQGLNPTQTQ